MRIVSPQAIKTIVAVKSAAISREREALSWRASIRSMGFSPCSKTTAIGWNQSKQTPATSLKGISIWSNSGAEREKLRFDSQREGAFNLCAPEYIEEGPMICLDEASQEIGYS